MIQLFYLIQSGNPEPLLATPYLEDIIAEVQEIYTYDQLGSYQFGDDADTIWRSYLKTKAIDFSFTGDDGEQYMITNDLMKMQQMIGGR